MLLIPLAISRILTDLTFASTEIMTERVIWRLGRESQLGKIASEDEGGTLETQPGRQWGHPDRIKLG
jgi:hypothetical protein